MIAEALKSKWMELRKSRDERAASLGLIYSNAQGIAKESNPTATTHVVTDEHALKAIRAGIKRLEDTIGVIGSKGGDISRETAERDMLAQLLPAQASEEAMRAEAQAFLDTVRASVQEVNMKNGMGPTIKHLESKFGAALDRGKASQIVKALLSA